MTVAKVRLGAHLAKKKKGSCAFVSVTKVSSGERAALPFWLHFPPCLSEAPLMWYVCMCWKGTQSSLKQAAMVGEHRYLQLSII